MKLKQYCAVLLAALVVVACGGGDEAAKATSADVSMAFAAAQKPQAAAATQDYKPGTPELFSWAEATFPQWFPSNGEPDRWITPADGDTITYRYYPITGNYLGVSTAGYVYVIGPITNMILLYVGRNTDFGCQVFPFSCAAGPAVPVISLQASWPEPAGRDDSVTGAIQGMPFTVTRYLTDGQAVNMLFHFYIDMTGYFGVYPANTAKIRIEDPHQLFMLDVSAPNASSYELSGSGSIAVTTGGRSLTPGLREGALKVHICLTSDCSVEAGNSPLEIPYRVEVVPATLTTNMPAVNINTPFGTVPAPTDVQVTLPPYTKNWGATLSTSNGFFDGGWATASTKKWANAAGGTVTLAFNAATVGTHSGTLHIGGTRKLPQSNSETSFSLDVPVTYSVAANPSVDYVFDKPELVIIAQAGYIYTSPLQGTNAAAAPGVSIYPSGIDYLGGPSNMPLASSWLSTYNGASYVQCGFSGSVLQCLPPGDYTARIRYTMTKAGVPSTVYLPVTLKLYP